MKDSESKCYYCGSEEVDPDMDHCYGCGKIVCINCIDDNPHILECNRLKSVPEVEITYRDVN
jgi:hypothetical protein